MLNCLFMGDRICSLDLDNRYGIRDTQIEKVWRKASQNNQLICEECGNVVILRAGKFKIPHFAHKGDHSTSCFYQTYSESEERKKAKSIIYWYLKKVYPNDKVEINYKHSLGIRSDFYINSSKSALAIELQRLELELNVWDNKNNAYDQLGIRPIWILFGSSSRIERFNESCQLSFFERLMFYETWDKILRLINVDNQEIILYKELAYRNLEDNAIKYRETYCKKYKINDYESNIYSDFNNGFKKKETEFCLECSQKEENLKRQNEERLKGLQLSKEYFQQNSKRHDSYKVVSFKTRKSDKNSDKRAPGEKKGTCIFCGEYTDQWWYFEGKTNTCKCYKCKESGKV